MRRVAPLCLVLGLACAGAAAPAAAGTSGRGQVRVLALIPPPGYPALPHMMAGVIYEGTYDNPQGTSLPSRVLAYSPGGELLSSWTVQGQDTSKPHGVQVAVNDSRDKLLLFDKTSGRIIRLDPRTGTQSLYAQVPDLPICSVSASGTPCSPESQDMAPFPDYGAWGPDGALYVTDYDQGVIFRISPGGGKAQVWLSNARLDGGMFGTACILLMPDHHTLLFDQASNGDPISGQANPSTGKLYEIGLMPGDKPGNITRLWESGPADAPDGCQLALNGHIFVALAGGSNQVVELDSTGHELTRFGQQYSGTNNSSVPYDTPSGLAFLGTDLIVANQAYLDGNTANMALLDLQTTEPGMSAFVPPNAGYTATPAAHHRAHKHPGHKRHRRHKHRKHRKRTRHSHDPDHDGDVDITPAR